MINPLADDIGADTIGSGDQAGGADTPAGSKQQWEHHEHAAATPPKIEELAKARGRPRRGDSDSSSEEKPTPRGKGSNGKPEGAASQHDEQHGQLDDLGAAAPGDAAVAAGGEAAADEGHDEPVPKTLCATGKSTFSPPSTTTKPRYAKKPHYSLVI